jgi:glycosyltransferase involved in cell wall biosynthesis
MSHEILSHNKEKDSHFKRIMALMDYEKERRQYAHQRWQIVPDDSLSEEDHKILPKLLAPLAVDLRLDASEPKTRKQIQIVSGSAKSNPPVCVRSQDNQWQLVWEPTTEAPTAAQIAARKANQEKTITVWKGLDINPLALKARDYQPNKWEFPQAGQRPILGFHLGMAETPIDVSTTRHIIENNPGLFFVFADIRPKTDSNRGEQIVAGLENAVYLGARPFGEAYQLYACFDALWLPPIAGDLSEHTYRTFLALAYTIARPLLLPTGFDQTIAAPYQFYYHQPDESLGFVKLLQRSDMDTELLNDYLAIWTTSGCMQQITQLANAATQENTLERPDFGIIPQSIEQPKEWFPTTVEVVSPAPLPLKCGLVVNTMDKGGLEGLVAQLAHSLPEFGVDTFVICAREGGTIAESLEEQGIRVYNARDNKNLMQQALHKEKPHLVNTHFAPLNFLEVATDLGIPIVETIHSSYIWLDRETWHEERRRSLFFTHAIATSNATRNYYAKWNNAFPANEITVIHTGIDPEILQVAERDIARQELGLSDEDFLFELIASYDGVKNQLGVLTAFDQVARQFPQARLICAGNIANPAYYQHLEEYHGSLKSRQRIELHKYRQDIGLMLSAADTFIINSFSEGWSLAATEALMAGVPIIHSHCGSAQELVGEDDERGIVVPNPVSSPIDLTRASIYEAIYQKEQRNTSELVQAMSQMLQNRDQWLAKRVSIRTQAREMFSINNMAQHYAQVFQKYRQKLPQNK